MSFIPKNKEERKWFYRVGILGVVVILLIGLFFIFVPILFANEFFGFLFDIILYGTGFFLLGTLVGFKSNLSKERLYLICFKGILFLEIIPITLFLFLIFLYRQLGFFIAILMGFGFLLLIGAILCVFGCYVSEKIKSKNYK